MFSPLLMSAVIAAGLYAGFMLTFLVVIMPGLALLPDDGFTAAMRRFNEKVPGPGFLLVFLGVVALPAAALVSDLGGRGDRNWNLVLAALVCAVISHLITITGNIPLNNALAGAEGAKAGGGVGGGGGGDATVARAAFESRWNTLHRIRTALSTASFVLLAAVVL
ncbi:DUF1772 domain-containing protein [Streptomyces finlayi]|uniref:DUF1772 domain-containing protein n=1 Tax=Streptomyces finlayi TaxID=67296 RepID=A0A7G7BPG1_9ACTN|nr:DUF1772 domain-containing protein [Streptomyces finlayi]QNE77226.1 DUF1772 domain-containing protein [Streptomyces finlayi]